MNKKKINGILGQTILEVQWLWQDMRMSLQDEFIQERKQRIDSLITTLCNNARTKTISNKLNEIRYEIFKSDDATEVRAALADITNVLEERW